MFRSVMLRFVLPVAFASCVVAYFGLPYIQRLLAEWFRSDVELRAQLVMHSMEEPITDLVSKGSEARLRTYLSKVTADERLLAILVCRPDGTTVLKTERAPAAISCDQRAVEPRGDAGGAAALGIGASLALRFRWRATAVSRADAARSELRRPAAAHGARLPAGVHRHLGAAAGAAGGAGCVAAAAPLGERADRRHPGQALPR